MIYLACPYSSDIAGLSLHRFEEACRAAAKLMRADKIVFCPIVHCHPMTFYGLPGDWKFWEKFDREFLNICTEVIVLRLPGWEESAGIKAELEIAKEKGIQISYIDPEPC
jgi:hypothetical protein